MKTLFYAFVIVLLQTALSFGQVKMYKELTVPVEKGVSWWVGVINNGQMMPLQNGYSADLHLAYGNEVQPLMISDHGDLVWSEDPYTLKRENDIFYISSPTGTLQKAKSGTTLRDAFLYASKNYFPPSGKMPDPLLFTAPQFNTWIELTYNQNQKDVLKYANAIIDNGFVPGVLMIDDNWQENYGKWDFHPGRFPNPKMMMDSLHAMGFKVMLWVCPHISPDNDVYRKLRDEEVLLKQIGVDSYYPAIIYWWNGVSAFLDLSNPKGMKWFKDQLDYLQETYDVDGFKLDGGDPEFYEGVDSYGGLTATQYTELFAKIALDYPLNEVSRNWKNGGQPIVNRLRDKMHTWHDVNLLIPDLLLQGIVGYSFTAPDMIGGGDYVSFLPGADEFDAEIVVRAAQIHALLPMMQFSLAPWRVLNEEQLNAVKKAAQIRQKYVPLILHLAEESAVTGEPIARSMEYVFPHKGYASINDQFLLGNEVLVAPVLEKGATKRQVVLPKGKWKSWQEKTYKGGKTIVVNVGLNDIPVFELVK